MGDLAETLEHFLSGTSEPVVFQKSLQQAPYSRESTVELAYHLMRANTHLAAQEALKQAHAYLTTRKNERDILSVFDKYAQTSRAMQSTESPDSLLQRVRALEQGMVQAERQVKQSDQEHKPYGDAYFQYYYASTAKGFWSKWKHQRAYKKFLTQHSLANDEEFTKAEKRYKAQFSDAKKHLEDVKKEFTLAKIVQASVEKKHELIAARQQREAGLDMNALNKLYDSVIGPSQNALSTYRPPSGNVMEDTQRLVTGVVHDVTDLSKHAIDKIVEATRTHGPPIIEVTANTRQSAALPAPRRHRENFSGDALKKLNQLLRKKTGMEFGYYDDLFKANPLKAIEEFTKRYGDDEVFYE